MKNTRDGVMPSYLKRSTQKANFAPTQNLPFVWKNVELNFI
jgi:hypothetical protein